MSMKTLFNRSSRVVRGLEIVGGLAALSFFFKAAPSAKILSWFFAFIVACHAFLRICDMIPWADTSRDLGIRVHFQKALVPSSYILAVSALAALLEIPVLSVTILATAVLMMLVIVPVNGILIYFHRRDRDPLPKNYFSSNQYKIEEAQQNRENIQTLQASPY